MRAHGRESDDHEMSLPGRLGELMSVMQAHDPGPVVRGPFSGARGIQLSMTRAEIQDQGHCGRWNVAFQNRRAKIARTGEVSLNVGPKTRISQPLSCLPLAQLRSVFAGIDPRHLAS